MFVRSSGIATKTDIIFLDMILRRKKCKSRYTMPFLFLIFEFPSLCWFSIKSFTYENENVYTLFVITFLFFLSLQVANSTANKDLITIYIEMGN
jgi:hypothetical protein